MDDKGVVFAAHEKYHDYIESIKDRATCVKEHARIKSALETVKTAAQLQEVPVGDQANVTVFRKPYEERK